MAIDETTSEPARERYARLIEGTLRWSLEGSATAVSGPAGVLPLARGLCYPAAVLCGNAGRALAFAGDALDDAPAVVDPAGHRRPVYSGLLLYSVFQAFRLARVDPSAQPVTGWVAVLERRLAAVSWPEGLGERIPASAGAAVTEVAWLALAARAAAEFVGGGGGGAAEIANVLFEEVARRQSTAGAFLTAGPRDNPETFWYHELVLLHAVASYAAQAGDAELAEAAGRSARFVQAEAQPDHATNQPWGLLAFVRDDATRLMADQMLHAARVQDAAGAGRSPITSILLADALYCLRALERVS